MTVQIYEDQQSEESQNDSDIIFDTSTQSTSLLSNPEPTSEDSGDQDANDSNQNHPLMKQQYSGTYINLQDVINIQITNIQMSVKLSDKTSIQFPEFFFDDQQEEELAENVSTDCGSSDSNISDDSSVYSDHNDDLDCSGQD